MAKAAAGSNKALRDGRFAPYMMSLPGLLWLWLFFLVPLVTLLKIALSTKPDRNLPIYNLTYEWGNFGTAFSSYGEQLARAFGYAAIATVLCVVIAYPIAYFISFKAGKWQNLLLGLAMVPFFTSFLLRTISWLTLLADNGPVLGAAKNLHLIGALDFLHITVDGRILSTHAAVIGGLTYNFLPFALLPIYVSLEKVDKRLIDAASDLYSSFGRAFRKVILPLSMPGVFAGTLLTFIPATGDFINAQLLGGPEQKVIGDVVQNAFLSRNDYPTAAAISFVLMAIITAAVLVYAKFLGTEDLV